jgi:3-deoxy-manno-octulosonate cytidylyltransferase (CMP-KDO synthetase)
MIAVGVIPARMASTRFPNKPMAKINNIPMIGHCYYRTKMASGLVKTYVATCDQEIADYIDSIGGVAIMTDSSHTRATTRTAEALEKIEADIGDKVDIVMMVQGDEPLIRPEVINEVLLNFKDADVDIVNVMAQLKTYEKFVDKNNVKVVFDVNNNALYFSREPIPSTWKGLHNHPMFMQTGIIAFRRNTLLSFNELEETVLEKIESVDMNRVLEMGGSIRMVPTDNMMIGVDTHQELVEAEKYLLSDLLTEKYKTL